MPRPVSKATVKRAEKLVANATKRLGKLEKKAAKSAAKFNKRLDAANRTLTAKQAALAKVVQRRDTAKAAVAATAKG